ncbi:right-handed parallel beta-helix repeat-containing protein, partial [Pseudomonas urmiensis]|uniref:right-handed parallel beta-helix repeat-containing protein n=1 Tax=Pseudomonas urmiensis TaxID=2745493 RepID=UPI0034D68DA8
TSETANRVVVTGNVIRGFQTGIAARGKTVTVSNNILEDISSIGIYPYLCDQAMVSSNIIDSDCLHIWVRESKDIKVSD